MTVTFKKSLSPNFTPQQGYFSVDPVGHKKQKAREHCVSRAFKLNQLLKNPPSPAKSGIRRAMVEVRRIELLSKHILKKLSTCLFAD